MKKTAWSFIVGILLRLVLAPDPVMAHHSQARYTGPEGAIEVRGVVTKVEMTSPHSFIYMDEIDKEGKPVLKNGKPRTWALEMQSVRGLAMNGWVDNTVKAGETITVIGRPARNGASAMYCEVVKLPDGRQMRS
jgi:hypothetical protein